MERIFKVSFSDSETLCDVQKLLSDEWQVKNMVSYSQSVAIASNTAYPTGPT